jgi:circadian clock protein KaiC
LWFLFEESPSQLMRNMRSIGIDLECWVERGLLEFRAARPTFFGLEMHLATMHRAINELQPRTVIVDPMSTLMAVGQALEVKSMLMRLIDFFKSQQITAVFTSLVHGGDYLEATDVGVSSIMDTWLLLRDMEVGGERNRVVYVLKSRGMAHSNQLREFLLTSQGVELIDVYVGPAGVVTGSARLAQEAREQASAVERRQAIELRQRELEGKRAAMEAQIAGLRRQFEAEQEELTRAVSQLEQSEQKLTTDRQEMAKSRKAD